MEALDLLKQLAILGAPSHQEDQRVAFISKWCDNNHIAYTVDDAKNVIMEYGCAPGEKVHVFMAHTDIVFPDTGLLPLKEDEKNLMAPGVGDDTANLVNLLLCVKKLYDLQVEVSCGLVFVANSCEEGLGNLKGSRKIVETYGDRIEEFTSFDGYYDGVTNIAVGSYRYRVSVKTEGGHSYGAFGNQNAIVVLSNMIQTLYTKKVPTKAKTTYNVGTIEGGTTVNSIAQSASMLYEFRSEDRECLAEMEGFFQSVISTYRNIADVEVELLGVRPCNGEIDEEKLAAFTQKNAQRLRKYTNLEIEVGAGSTDASIPLSMGIIANTYGTVMGGKAHTREEYIEKDSMEIGWQIAWDAIGEHIVKKA